MYGIASHKMLLICHSNLSRYGFVFFQEQVNPLLEPFESSRKKGGLLCVRQLCDTDLNLVWNIKGVNASPTAQFETRLYRERRWPEQRSWLIYTSAYTMSTLKLCVSTNRRNPLKPNPQSKSTLQANPIHKKQTRIYLIQKTALISQ